MSLTALCVAVVLTSAPQTAAATPPAPLAAAGETATWYARAELVGGQTLVGAGLGLSLGLLTRNNSVGVGATIGGVLVGGLGSWLLSGNGISTGPAMALNAGAFWGGANGMMLAVLAGRARDYTSVGGALVSVGILGLGAGAWAATDWKPRAGQIALANTVAFWSLATGAGLVAMTGAWNTLEPWAGGIGLLTINAGLAAGLWMSNWMEISRLRAALLDVGGMLGALLGLGLATVFQGPSFSYATFGALSAGAVVGLGVSAYLTRNLQGPVVPEIALVPMVGDAHRGLALVGRL